MLQYFGKKQVCLIKKRKCFSCKEKYYIIYECFRKQKIGAILKDLIEDNSS